MLSGLRAEVKHEMSLWSSGTMRRGHITGVTAKGIAFRILDKDINLQPVRSERVKCKTNSVCNSHGRPERVVEDKVSTQNLQRALKVK